VLLTEEMQNYGCLEMVICLGSLVVDLQ